MNASSLSQEVSALAPRSSSAAAVLGAGVLGGVLGALVVVAVGSSSETSVAVEASLPVRSMATSPSAIDHSAVDWSQIPREPDVSPMSVAAYD